MDHLLAKMKGRNGEYLKVFSNDPIYDLPANLENVYEYAPGVLLDEDEWFCIDDFSQQDYFLDFLGVNFQSANYNQIHSNQYSQIRFLCSVQGQFYYFQKISAASILRKKYFTLTDAPVLVQNQPIIILNNEPDAIYDKEQDRLYFKNLGSISTVFKGIAILFREATNAETRTFLGHHFISLQNGYNADDVQTMNRKRIALATEVWDGLNRRQRKEMTTYIHDYCPSLPFNQAQGVFDVSSEEDLKSLLYGLLERYYTTNRGEKRVANSVRTLD